MCVMKGSSMNSLLSEAGTATQFGGGLTRGVGMTPFIPHSCSSLTVSVRLSRARETVIAYSTRALILQDIRGKSFIFKLICRNI